MDVVTKKFSFGFQNEELEQISQQIITTYTKTSKNLNAIARSSLFIP